MSHVVRDLTIGAVAAVTLAACGSMGGGMASSTSRGGGIESTKIGRAHV